MMKRADMAKSAPPRNLRDIASEGRMNIATGMGGGMNLRPINNSLAGSLDDDNSDAGFCSKKSFYFLVPPKETLGELITVMIIAPLYGFFATYLAHPKTAEMVLTSL